MHARVGRLLILLFYCVVCAGQMLDVRIGALFTSGDCCNFLNYEDKASAINIAIDQLHEDGIINKDNINFT
mgnify:CR=1 FL=1